MLSWIAAGIARVFTVTVLVLTTQGGLTPATATFGPNQPSQRNLLSPALSVPEAHAAELAAPPGPGSSSSTCRSLQLNGTTGLAEAAAAPDLNIVGDWTVEAWFKDEDPNGFNHDYRQILMKGDRNANPEAPYYVLVGQNNLIAGVRTWPGRTTRSAGIWCIWVSTQNSGTTSRCRSARN